MKFKVTRLDPIPEPQPNYETIIQLADRLNVLIEDFNQRNKKNQPLRRLTGGREMRYYYDCPIEAAYMAKNFGFKFRSCRNQILYFDGGSDFRSEKDCGIYGGEYYFIDPDSLKLLGPQLDDLCEFSQERCFDCGNYIDLFHESSPKVGEIIQRNSKPFIMPKREANPTNEQEIK